MSKLFSFRYDSSSLPFWSNALAIPKHNVCTHENNHQISVMGDGLQGRSYLEDLDCLGTYLLEKVGGLKDLRMVDGLVDAENRKVPVRRLEF